MVLYKHLESKKKVGPIGYEINKVSLTYSVFSFLSGNPRWFCRIHEDDWDRYIATGLLGFRQAWGKTKFEAYRKAKQSPLVSTSDYN